jgi:hypothetical protein
MDYLQTAKDLFRLAQRNNGEIFLKRRRGSENEEMVTQETAQLSPNK